MSTQMPISTPETARSIQTDIVSDEQARRAGLYSVLAALLRNAPDQGTLAFVAQLHESSNPGKDEIPVALQLLALAAQHSRTSTLRDEFHALFVGLGRGELVPYGSWYQTGFLMEKPLSLLRSDLARLGFERDESVHEPEDHIAALCEVMAMLIQDDTAADIQRAFFDQHIACWAGDFFNDAQKARSAVFYKSVARLGAAFIDMENRYLSMRD